MPTRSTEAHRALEQLEAFHASLIRPTDVELRYAIERVIGIFKANLFQALLDIQDFYDNTLLNERVPLDLKTVETKKLAERWEHNPPFGTRYISSSSSIEQPTFPTNYDAGPSSYTNGVETRGISESAVKANVSTTSHHEYSYHEQNKKLTKDGWQMQEYKTQTVDTPSGFQTETVSNTGLIDDAGREWEVEDVVLEKNQFGLGFSISGGKDHPLGPYIRVTDISSGGAVARDGRICVGDIILKVNTTETVDVPHQVAVDALKGSGSVVRLLVKRLKPPLATAETFRSASDDPMSRVSPSSNFANSPPIPAHQLQTTYLNDAIRALEQRPGVRRMELIKIIGPDGRSKGLGFSIAGGIGNQHYPGDDGIFVTRIIEGSSAYYDGRLQRGDQILAVDNVIFNNVTHQFAVNTLKNTGERVSLLYLKNPHPDLESINKQLEENDRTRSLQAFDTTSPGEFQQLPNGGGGSLSHLNYPQQVPELSNEPRLVRLRKGDTGLGFNIVGGEDGEPVYVSHVLPGGPADLSGNVKKGDVMLRVNDVNLQNASHARAAQALKSVPMYSEVQLLLQYRPYEYQLFEEKLERLRHEMLPQYPQTQTVVTTTPQPILPPPQDFFIRTLFDNESSRDTSVPHRSLAFNYGDILHVTNVTDDDWWTARKVAENGDEGPEGIIPSKKRVEKRERQRRKQVNFNAGSQSLGRNASIGYTGGMEGRRGSRSQLSFSRKFPFVKSTEKLNEYGADGAENAAIAEEPIHSYESVELQSINYVRPVIILGALKDRINDELVTRHPDRFSSCVPHTSRPPRENEMDGRDYYFVSKAEMERDVKNNLFIEAGQFQNNLYGTSIAAVQEVANSGRHCILDVSGNAIRRLQNAARIYPISIFVKPFNHHQLREWDPQLNEEDALRQFERCQRQEQSFGDLFTVIVTGHSPEDIYARVHHIINEQSRPNIWVPTQEQLP